MWVRCKKKSDSRWQIQIVESLKVDGKTKQKILRNVGTAYSEKEKAEFLELGESIAVAMRNAKNPVLPFADPKEVHKSRKKAPSETVRIESLQEEKRIYNGFELVLKPLFNELELSTKNDKVDDTIFSLVMARAFKPSSKLSAHKNLKKFMDVDIPLHDIYRSMDSLIESERVVKNAICNKTLNLLNQKVDIMFFDVTTLYFESQNSDDLRDFGFSKDCKFNEVQVMLALVTGKDGLPITYKLFPGNQYEGNTLIPIIQELKKEFKVEHIFLAADRGLFNKSNLNEMDALGIRYVVGAKLKTMSKPVKKEVLSDHAVLKVIHNEAHWVKEMEHEGRRLIVGYSSKRARKDQRDRHKLVDRLLKKAKDGKVDGKKIIGNRGTAKYIKGNEKTKYEIDSGKIEQEKEWDGLYGVITNTEHSIPEVLEKYRSLWQIEQAFRVNKTDLKMRPIYHWTPKRIQAHILLCYITYAVLKYLEFQLCEAGLKLSPRAILDAISDIQSSVLINKFSGKKYLMPSNHSPEAESILKALKISFKQSASPIK